MTSHVLTSFDRHHTIYNQRNYIQTTYSSSNTNPLYLPLPIPSVNLCENLLYETRINEDHGSTTSSSYINSSSEHYDNAFTNTYDSPMEYHENYIFKQSLINIPDAHENFYDNPKGVEINQQEKSSKKSSYLGNKGLVLYTCLISIVLLIIITSGIFLINKFLHPVVIHATINHHYDQMNVSNITTRPITTPVMKTTVAIGNLPFPYSTCPFDRWGIGCQNICKPCGLGVCHSVTGKCICPADIYGEFCDLWKVNDQPKRGDMMS